MSRGAFDPAAAVRRYKPPRRTAPLSVRPADPALRFATLDPLPRRVLLDPNVHIRSLAGTLPPDLKAVLDRVQAFASSVCIAELAVGLGHLNPADPAYAAKTGALSGLIAAIPPHRIITPDADTWGQAGLVAGMISRTQGYQPHQRKDLLNDPLILLCANKAGLPVLTDNHADFDLLRQCVGGVVHHL